MKTRLALSFSCLLAGSAAAGPAEDAVIAAMKLAEIRNYSWISSVSDDARTYDIEGKTRADGYTWQRQPMPKTISNRLGRHAGRDLEAIFLRPQHYVIRTPEGWKMLADLPKRHRDWRDESDWYFISPPAVRPPSMPAGETDGLGFGLPAAIRVPVQREQDADRAYSNAQFALALPHDELAIVVSSHDEWHVEGNVVTGSLTDLGARLLLVHDGHEYLTPVVADGRFRLIVEGGLVSRYTIELAGIILVENKPRYVRQRSTTSIKDIGASGLVVPPEVLKRLGR
jgi:hypothetical protein